MALMNGTMNIAFTAIEDNIAMSFEWTIILIVFLGGLLFYAKDFKLGVVLHFFGFGLIFMWFYAASYYYIPAMVIFFIFMVILAFTLYGVAKTAQQGAVI